MVTGNFFVFQGAEHFVLYCTCAVLGSEGGGLGEWMENKVDFYEDGRVNYKNRKTETGQDLTKMH